MAEQNEHYSVKVSKIHLPRTQSGGVKDMPKLEVVVKGTPGIAEVVSLMSEINKIAKTIEGEYISVTDLTELNINQFFRTVILRGMEAVYKTVLSVRNPARLSFVALGNNPKDATMTSDTIKSINS